MDRVSKTLSFRPKLLTICEQRSGEPASLLNIHPTLQLTNGKMNRCTNESPAYTTSSSLSPR
jgi:hypothetical protein